MESNLSDPIFCYPDNVRFSWGPAKKSMKDLDIKVEWEADEEDGDEKEDIKQTRMNMFLKKPDKRKATNKQSIKKRQRLGFFKKLNLDIVSEVIKT